MISHEEAVDYQGQLHPAFAGYLHDGQITERDCLAVIFKLFINGVLQPVWEDGTMNKRIVGVKLLNAKPGYSFEELFIKSLFKDVDELSAYQVGKAIKEQYLQEIIKQNLKAIGAFPVINKQLKFTYKGVPIPFTDDRSPVDTPEKERNLRIKLLISVPTYAFIAVCSFLGSTLLLDDRGLHFDFTHAMDSTQDFLILSVLLILAYLFFASKRNYRYDFANNVVPVAKKKYDELYKFIEAHPLQPHNFVNEFLPFAIAFGLDSSWFADFGLYLEN